MITRGSSFGVFDFDLTTGELRKHGVRVRLARQSLEILHLLVERPGDLVTRAEIQERLWPNGEVVDFEHSINTAVARLREVMGESATSPRLIETVPGRGYRMLIPVQSIGSISAASRALPAEGPPAGSEVQPWRSKYSMAFLAGFGLLLAVLAGRTVLPKAGSSGTVQSIAVMPFANLSGDPAQEYLADWMTEQLISHFTGFKAFRVTSHTSVRRYKGQTKTVPEIGHELKVDAVLEGSVRVSGDAILTSARLIDTRTDRPVWSDSYRREFRDLLVAQSDIARAIVTSIRIRVTPEEMARLAARGGVRQEALEAYLKGRHALELSASSDHGVKFYREAVQLDPGFALGWATLAVQQAGLLQREDMPLSEEVLSAAKKALELDARLAEAHVAMGEIEFFWNWNWEHGEAEYRRALELNPGSVDALVHYGVAMMVSGHTDLGLQHMQRAAELDPMSPVISGAYGHWLRVGGKPQSAVRQLQHSIGLSPTYAANYSFLADAYENLGQEQAAFDARVKAATLNGQSAETIQTWRRKFESGGLVAVRRHYGQARVRNLTERAQRSRVSPVEWASAYAAVGDAENSRRWLEVAYENRSPQLPLLKLDTSWDPIRTNPEFQKLMARMNLLR